MTSHHQTRGRLLLIAAGVAFGAGCGRPGAAPGPIRAEVQFGEVGTYPGQFSYPRAIDSGDGSLWVIDKMARVQRFTPEGKPLGEWRMPEMDLGKPTGVTVWDPDPTTDGDEIVLVPDTHYHRVMMYGAGTAVPDGGIAPESALIAKFGSYGTGDGQFIYPTDVAVLATPDGKGIARLYVSEYGGNDRISIFEPTETGYEFVKSFGKFGSGAGVEFNRPQSMAIDRAKGELIVTDGCNHRVGRFTLEGELVEWIGGPGDAPGRFKYPYGLALLGDGTALVAEFGGCRVQRIDLETGESLGVFGERGRMKGELASPWGVAVMGDLVYVLDSGNNRVMGFERPRGHRPLAASEGNAH